MVFLSYAHMDETVVNIIDAALQENGITVTRDIRDIPDFGNIKDFMDKIGDSDNVIIVISENYLHSPNCLYEIVELVKNKNYAERIVPVVFKNVCIHTMEGRMKYYVYWNEKYESLDQQLKEVGVLTDISSVIANDLRLLENIKSNILGFLNEVASIKYQVISGDIITHKTIAALVNRLKNQTEKEDTTDKKEKLKKIISDRKSEAKSWAEFISGFIFTLLTTLIIFLIYQPALDMEKIYIGLNRFFTLKNIIFIVFSILFSILLIRFIGLIIGGLYHHCAFTLFDKLSKQARKREKEQGKKYPARFQHIIYTLFRKGTIVETICENVDGKWGVKYEWINDTSKQIAVDSVWAYAKYVDNNQNKQNIYSSYFSSSLFQFCSSVCVLDGLLCLMIGFLNPFLVLFTQTQIPERNLMIPFLFIVILLAGHRLFQQSAIGSAKVFLHEIGTSLRILRETRLSQEYTMARE
jgi:uncharacterized membrane protein